jgi:hypothetical protein
VNAGANQKLYIPSHRGLFVGQSLRVTGEAGGFGGVAEIINVKDLGLDQLGRHIVADLVHNHPQGALVYNKNVVNGMCCNFEKGARDRLVESALSHAATSNSRLMN